MSFLSSRSSSIWIFRPRFRKASSRSRFARMSNAKSVVSKISGSGLKRMVVPRFVVFSPGLQVALRLPAIVALGVDVAVPADLDLEPLGERVDDRDTDPVEAARHLVDRALELAAGVELREDDLGRRLAGLPVDVHRDAAAVVDDRAAPVGVEDDPDVRAEAGQRLVDRVVDHLEDQVVEPVARGVPDVHRGPLADGFEPLEDLDVARGVAGGRSRAPGFGSLTPHPRGQRIERLDRAQGVTCHAAAGGPAAGTASVVEKITWPWSASHASIRSGRADRARRARRPASSTGGDRAAGAQPRPRRAAASAPAAAARPARRPCGRPRARCGSPGRRDAGRRASAPRWSSPRAGRRQRRQQRVPRGRRVRAGGDRRRVAERQLRRRRRHRPRRPGRLRSGAPGRRGAGARSRCPSAAICSSHGASSASASPRPASRPSRRVPLVEHQSIPPAGLGVRRHQLRARPVQVRPPDGRPPAEQRQVGRREAHDAGPRAERPHLDPSLAPCSVSRTSRRWLPCSTSPATAARRVPRDALAQPGRAERSSGQQQVERLEERGLALTVRADQDVEPGLRLEAEGGVIAKADQLEPSDMHPERASSHMRIGIITQRYASSGRVLLRAPRNTPGLSPSLSPTTVHGPSIGPRRVQDVARVEPDRQLVARALGRQASPRPRRAPGSTPRAAAALRGRSTGSAASGRRRRPPPAGSPPASGSRSTTSRSGDDFGMHLLVVRELPLDQLRHELEAFRAHEELALADGQVDALRPRPGPGSAPATALRGTMPAISASASTALRASASRWPSVATSRSSCFRATR